MELNDNLVKLASIGTAGISILAVFVTGIIIYKLPNDVSKEKTGMLKFFIISCFVFVILSTGTGITNALFNKDVIDEKEEKLTEVTTQYKAENIKWLNYKDEVGKEFAKIENQLNQPNVNKEIIRSDIKKLNAKTLEMKFSPIVLDKVK